MSYYQEQVHANHQYGKVIYRRLNFLNINLYHLFYNDNNHYLKLYDIENYHHEYLNVHNRYNKKNLKY